MGFNQILSSIFGNKSTRDMKEIQPWVNKVKAVYPEIQKLDNDALRAKTEELKASIRKHRTGSPRRTLQPTRPVRNIYTGPLGNSAG